MMDNAAASLPSGLVGTKKGGERQGIPQHKNSTPFNVRIKRHLADRSAQKRVVKPVNVKVSSNALT